MRKYKHIKYPNSNIVEEIEYNEPEHSIKDWIKIDGGSMINVNTGEKKDAIKKSKNKSENVESARASLLKANELIKFNFLQDVPNVYSIELTYAITQYDYNEFQKDLTLFLKKLKRLSANVKYVVIKETSANGGFHSHLILSKIKLTEYEVRKKWGHGEIYFSLLKSNKDLLYKASYLTNITGYSEKAKEKRYRLFNFPTNKHLYIASKNLKKPIFKKGPAHHKCKKIIFETPDKKIKKTGTKYTTFKTDIA